MRRVVVGLIVASIAGAVMAQGNPPAPSRPPLPQPVGRVEAHAAQVGSVLVTYRLDTASGQVTVCGEARETCLRSAAVMPLRRGQRIGQYRIVGGPVRFHFIYTVTGILHRCSAVGVNDRGELTGDDKVFGCVEHL